MTPRSGRALNFSWPTADVTRVRIEHRAARRVYRRPAPEALDLTLSAFTETAYKVARERITTWQTQLLSVEPHQNGEPEPREALSVTWTAATAALLDDDWDDLVELALRNQAAFRPSPEAASRLRVRKSEVARLAVLNGLEDWHAWIRSCPNDPRRGRR